jgi:DNA-directed RNA polymerase specialized sigma24 family protein
MDDHPEVGGFPSTRWSLIYSAHDQHSAHRREALGELLRLYLPALRAHLLYRRNIEPHRAEDLLQGFVTDQILQRDLLGKAEAGRGRFRSFLLKSLENYVINQRQRAAARREVQIEEDVARIGTANIFEVEWARQLLQETLRRMSEECEKKGRPEIWDLFEGFVVGPTLAGSPLPSNDSPNERFGFRSAQQAYNALVTAKRQFKRTLRAVISETECVAGEMEIEAEISDLCQILKNAGPLAVECDRGLIAGPQPSAHRDISALDDSKPEELACLLSVQGTPEGNWQPAELSELLRHCLDRSVGEYLKGLGRSAEFAAASPLEFAVVEMSLGELFQSADPPLGLLVAVKRGARRLMSQGASDVPAEAHHLIYFASIAAALVRHGQRISKSGPKVLRVGFSRIAADPDSVEWLRQLFTAANELLSDQGLG